MSAPLNVSSPSSLKDIVEIIGDWDVPDGDVAKPITIMHPPGNGLFLIVQYRTPIRASWQFGRETKVCSEYQFAATQVQSGAISINPTGPLGVMAIYLKPEAAISVLGSLKEFMNIKVDLRDIFRPSELERLHELLVQSRQSSQRVAHIEAFLVQNARRAPRTSVAQHAARSLRSRPGLHLSRLAVEMGISARHLSRAFQESFGVGPKRFAKVARIEKVMAGRREGLTWADISYACGFCDQSHMIRDFKEIVGKSPTEFFQPTGDGGAPLLVGGSNLTFTITKTDEQSSREAVGQTHGVTV